MRRPAGGAALCQSGAVRLPLLLITLLAAVLAAAPARAQDQVTLCHATGNPENPYTTVTVDNAGALEHINHDEDLVPAPAEGCPASTVVLPDDTPAPTPTPAYVVPTPAPTITATPTPRPPRGDDGDDDRGDDDGDDDGGAVKGGGGSGGGSPTLTSSPSATQAADTRNLPMTGAEMWLIAGAGIGFLLSGTGIRLLSPAAGRPPGPSGR